MNAIINSRYSFLPWSRKYFDVFPNQAIIGLMKIVANSNMWCATGSGKAFVVAPCLLEGIDKGWLDALSDGSIERKAGWMLC